MPTFHESSWRIRFIDAGDDFIDMAKGQDFIDLSVLPEEDRWALTGVLERHLGGGFDSLMGDEILEVSEIKTMPGHKVEALVRFKRTLA